MVTGIVLLTVERTMINDVAGKLADMDGITEVFSVGGVYDLIAIIRTSDNEQLAEIVTDKMLKIDGIDSSETMIAFKVFSNHDLEQMFSIGLDLEPPPE